MHLHKSNSVKHVLKANSSPLPSRPVDKSPVLFCLVALHTAGDRVRGGFLSFPPEDGVTEHSRKATGVTDLSLLATPGEAGFACDRLEGGRPRLPGCLRPAVEAGDAALATATYIHNKLYLLASRIQQD